MQEWFDIALVRFGVSGTLIALYGAADALARRSAGISRHAESATPRWVHLAIFASITLYYVLIQPFGGALLAGLGLGLVAELLVRSGAPEGESYLRVFAVLGGGIILTAGGLVAEWFCTVPKDGGDEPGAGPTAPAG